MNAIVLRGDARALPLPDASVDLIVTSPPYFGLRSYTDGGEHYEGQIGSEASPREWLAALVDCTAEWMRVLKPSGSLFVNLGDKYSQRTQTRRSSHQPGIFPGKFPEFGETWAERAAKGATRMPHQNVISDDGAYVAEKSLMGLPWRYALACTDQLGLILRAEIIWAKPNGLPESVTDRVRRAHEQVFHFTRQPRYYAAVDEIREEHTGGTHARRKDGQHSPKEQATISNGFRRGYFPENRENPLGKLPGSVWDIPSQPLTVPARLGIDHFAAFPMELPRRLILGWSPPGVCVACGEGRRPVVDTPRAADHVPVAKHDGQAAARGGLGATSQLKLSGGPLQRWRAANPALLLGYACACPEPTAPTRPAIVLDPFGGTGTTALVAAMHGRAGITIDHSADYCRLAAWRTTDPAQRAAALGVPKPPPIPDGMEPLFT